MVISSQISQNNTRMNRNCHKILPVASVLSGELCCWWLLKQPDNWIRQGLLCNGIEKRPLL